MKSSVFVCLGISIICLNTAWAQPLTVTTLAGQFGVSGYTNAVGTSAQFYGFPENMAADAAGNVYVLDYYGVRKIATDGTVTTFAGQTPYGTYSYGPFGFLPEEGSGGTYNNSDIAVDSSGNIYITELENFDVLKIPGGVDTRLGDFVTTLAGNGYPGHTDGASTNAQFFDPCAITVDTQGNVYVADGDNYPAGPRIRKITPAGVVTTIAGDGTIGSKDGNGTNAEFELAAGLAVDSGGTIYVADGWTVRKISPSGNVTTWAGDPNTLDYTESDGVGTNALFGGEAYKIALDGTGGAYVTDGDTIRYVSSGGGVSTVAGVAGQAPTTSNEGVGSSALFNKAFGITVDAARNVYISDAGEDTILKGVPPSLDPIDSFSASPGGTPVRSSNPWQFSAYYTNIVSDLRLRVQSTTTTNDEGSWTDLPDGGQMTDVDGTWTLNTTEVPTGMRYFRVVASAAGYLDSASAAVGPENVLEGFDLWGYFSYATTVPYSTATAWSFAIGQPSQIPGMSLRMQSSATPDDPNSWSDLPGGGQMTRYSDGQNWVLYTTNLPAGLISFRVIASASNYVDLISGELGPFDIGLPLPVTSTNVSQGGTYTLQDFFGIGAAIMNVIHVVGVAVHLIPADNTTTTQNAITLTADTGGSVDLKIDKGQLLTTAGVDVESNATMVVSGTVDGDVSVGDNGSDSLIGHDSGSLIGHNSVSFAQNETTTQIADAVLAKPRLISQDGSGLISQDGSGIVSAGGGNVIGYDGGSVVNHGVKGFTPPSGSPFQPKPNIPLPTQPTFTGQMTINGNYSEFPGTALAIGIAGTNTLSDGAQQYDQLVVSGQATLEGGTIVFDFFNPDDQTNQAGIFQPADGATFDVVVASNIVVGAVHILGPVWGDGLFFSGSVVTRDDGLQAVRLTATHIPPQLFLQGGGSAFKLLYATNYTGYTIQSAASFSSSNWTTFSTGTNVIAISLTNSSQFFRLIKQ
jgi:hypothetical protein